MTDEERRRRGPQKAPTLVPINLRIDPDVLEAYRATGDGWQRLMRATLTRHAPGHLPGRRRYLKAR